MVQDKGLWPNLGSGLEVIIRFIAVSEFRVIVQGKDKWPKSGSGLEVRFNFRVGIQGRDSGSEFRIGNQGQE
jgi:hypothetical protein